MQTTVLYLNLGLMCHIIILNITSYLFLNFTDRVITEKECSR